MAPCTCQYFIQKDILIFFFQFEMCEKEFHCGFSLYFFDYYQG